MNESTQALMTYAEIKKLVMKAPQQATHYSPYRHEYYAVSYDANLQRHIMLWDKFNDKWIVDHRIPNFSKWISLIPDTLNDGHWVEAMDRLQSLNYMVEELLGNEKKGYHPIIDYLSLEKDVDDISEKLANLYQKIGAKSP